MINVLYQFNEAYAPFAGTSVTSLFENNKGTDFTVYILGENLSAVSIKRFSELAERYGQQIVFVDTLDAIDKIKSIGMPSYRGSYAANLRLFIPWFVDEDISRMIYLDSDTVINGSIQEFYDTDLESATIAMVIDCLGNAYKEEYLGLKKGEPYYNSGVILFDLDKWKKGGFSEKIVEYVKKGNNHYPSPDQDLLNVIMKNEIKLISPKYNFQPFHYVYSYKSYYKCFGSEDYYSQQVVDEAKNNVVVYHSFRYVGEFPWNENSMHPYRELFEKYLRISPWKDYKSEKAKNGVMMKIEKILYRILPKAFFLRVFSMVHHRYIVKSPEAKVEKKRG